MARPVTWPWQGRPGAHGAAGSVVVAGPSPVAVAGSPPELMAGLWKGRPRNPQSGSRLLWCSWA